MITKMIITVLFVFVLPFLWGFYLKRNQNYKLIKSIWFGIIFGCVSVIGTTLLMSTTAALGSILKFILV